MKKKPKELRQGHRYHQLLSEKTDYIIFHYRLRPDFICEFISPAVKNILGYSREEFYQDPFLPYRIIHPDDLHSLKRFFIPVFGKMNSLARWIKSDGQMTWLEQQIIPIYQDGFLTGVTGISQDATNRINIEAELKKYKNIFLHSGLGIAVGSGDELEVVNPAFARMHGYTVDEIQGQPIRQVFAPEFHDKIAEVTEIIHSRGHFIYEADHIKKDGTVFPVMIESTAVFDGETPLYRVASIFDISQIKKAEKETQKQKNRAEALVKTAARFNARLDLNGVLKAVAEEAAKAFEIKMAAVALYDAVSDSLRYVTDVGIELDHLGHYPIPKSLLDRLTGNAEISKLPIEAIKELPNSHIFDYLNLRSIVLVKMIHQNSFIGVLVLLIEKGSKPFTEENFILIKGLAAQAGMAVSNAMLFEQVKHGQEQLRSLSNQVIVSQEEERKRLSRELHDEAGQSLTALKINLKLIAADLPAEFEKLRERLACSDKLIDATLEEIRLMARNLRPPAFEELGLNAVLESFCLEFSERTKIPLFYDGVTISQIREETGICLYRCLQETLTNIAKHSGTSEVRVRLQCLHHQVILSVDDNGMGFDGEQLKRKDIQGLGIMGIKERVKMLNGTAVIRSEPGKGACVTISIPLEATV